MKIKILGIFIIGIFILSSFGASAGSVFNLTKNIKWYQKEVLSLSRDDELDQSQIEMDFFAPVGNIFLAPEINYITAQSFIPTKNILTRVEILAGKNSSASYDFTLAIRDDLLGSDLTSLSLPPEDFVTENFSWLEFDFNDIYVTPGFTYYIVCYTYDEPDNWYAWGAELTDVYFNGTVWWSEDDGASFEEDPDADLTFKTYGFDNTAPDIPTINGPSQGKPGVIYEFELLTIDPDGDDVIYCIDWGDDTGEVNYGPFPSGVSQTITHSWPGAGTYLIKAKAKDIYDAESDWAELTIKIPRDKSINTLNQWLQNFLQSYPNLFPIIRQLLNL